MAQLDSALLLEHQNETQQIIADLLDDGSELDALYTIEHHIVSEDAAILDNIMAEAYKLGFELTDVEEYEMDDDTTLYCCDAISESPLSCDTINAQVEQLLTLTSKYDATYDGWGTYFIGDDDSDEDDDEEAYYEQEEDNDDGESERF